MSKKRFLVIFALAALLGGCSTEKRNPTGGALVGRDAGDAVAVTDIPLRPALSRSFQMRIFPTRMGEREELLVGQMNGFLLRSLLRFTVPIGAWAENAGGTATELTLDSLRVNLGIRASRLVENASLAALTPDSPWEELQTFVDTLSLTETEVLATPIVGAVTQVLENRVQIALPVSVLEDARQAEPNLPTVELLLQPEGAAAFLLDLFAREATSADSAIPTLEVVYRVGEVSEREAVQAGADTYWNARVDGGPPEDLLILSEGLFYGSILNFDLPTDIPPGATVNSAKLRFAMDLDRSYFSSLPFGIYRLTFSEGARDTAFTAYNTSLAAEPTTATYTFNQTLIQAWTSGVRENQGLALSPLNFATSRLGTPINSPPIIRWLVLKDVRLDLIYSLPPEL